MGKTYNIYQSIFSSSTAGFVVHVDGVITDINDTAVRMLAGTSRNDIIGRRFMEDFIHPDFHAAVKQRREQLTMGNPSLEPLDMQLKRLDGKLVDVLSAATGRLFKGSLHAEVLLIDIASSKRRERLFHALADIWKITTNKDRPLDIKEYASVLEEAMHHLYPETMYSGFVPLSPILKYLFTADGNLQKIAKPIFSSFSLSTGLENWLKQIVADFSQSWDTRSVLPLVIDIPSSIEFEGKVVLQPIAIDDTLIGSLFWLFRKGNIPISLDFDRERLETFSFEVSRALKTVFLIQENVQRLSDLNILYRATLQIGKMDKLQDIANTVLDMLKKEKGWYPSVIRFKSRTTEALETIAYRSSNATENEKSQFQLITKMNKLIQKPGQGMTGYVIEHGLAIRSLDLPSDPHYIETDPGIRYGIYAPITVEGNVEGAIGVESATYAFSESDLTFLSSLGELVGIAVRSVRLIEVLRERLRWLEILHILNYEIGIETTPEQLYTLIIDHALEATNAESGALLIYDANKNMLTLRAARGWIKAIMEQPFATNEGITGHVFSTGESHFSPQLENDPFLSPERKKLIPRGKANICVPVIAGTTVIGVFHLGMKTASQVSREFINLTEMFGSYAGLIIRRYELIEALKSSQKDLLESYDATIEGWARAMGIRDIETFEHTRRVVEIALAIGKAMHLDAQSLEDLRRGSLLHDIGKIGIPDSILLKPASLTKEEQQIMQSHASFGYELLKPIKYLERAIVVPYCHHERWDGSGYPQQLRGEEIPLLARIFAIADVYDAMTTDRPYRPALSRAEALAYITSQSGKHFDPHIVEVFLKIADSI